MEKNGKLPQDKEAKQKLFIQLCHSKRSVPELNCPGEVVEYLGGGGVVDLAKSENADAKLKRNNTQQQCTNQCNSTGNQR